MKLTAEQGMVLSAIIDKMDLQIDLDALMSGKSGKKISDEELQKKFGVELIMQLIRKAYKAKEEWFELIACMKEITTEEAKKVDLVSFFGEFIKTPGVMDFFGSAVKSQDRD